LYKLHVVWATRLGDGDDIPASYFSFIGVEGYKVDTNRERVMSHIHKLPPDYHAAVATYEFHTKPALIDFVCDETGERDYSLLTLLSDITSASDGFFVWYPLD
jgi:hypothetical protein